MALTAATPLAEAKVLLNDPSGTIFQDTKIIPLLQKAYAELQTKMMLNGLPVLKEASATTTVNAGVTALGDGSGLPSDFIYPIELAERTSGSADRFEPMDEKAWEPDVEQSEKLIYWNWREEEIKFVGATANRDVRIRYMKGLTRITADTTPLYVNNCTTYLAARAAALAAFLHGGNPQRGAALADDATNALNDLLGILVKRQQGVPVRRRVNRYRR